MATGVLLPGRMTCIDAADARRASTASTSRLTVIPTRWAIAKSLASWKLGKPSWSTLIAAPRVVIRKSSQSVCGCASTHAISSICGSPASLLARATDHRPEPFLSTDGGAAPFKVGPAIAASPVERQVGVALHYVRSAFVDSVSSVTGRSPYDAGCRRPWNGGSGSYGLKHKAERFAGGYIANGMLIAAALALGFSAWPTHPDYPNAFFNISSKLATPPDHHAD
jgi:hypothetical protein